jgi:hypothetical protein
MLSFITVKITKYRRGVISFLVFIEHCLWSMIFFSWLAPKHVTWQKLMKQLFTSNELLKKANITNLYSCFTNYCPNLTKTMSRLTCLIKMQVHLVFLKNSTLYPTCNISCNKWQIFPLCSQLLMYTAISFPVMTTGISLCTNSHREVTVMKTGSLQWEQGFPVLKGPCPGPVRDCSVHNGWKKYFQPFRL